MKLTNNKAIITLPTDKQVKKWWDENIDRECSASSAVYKFRLWLATRKKNG